MKKIMAAMAFTLVALFSAPVVYAAEECKSFSMAEINMAMEEAGAQSRLLEGKEAGDFLRSLAEVLVAPHQVSAFLEAAGEFSSIKVFVKNGNPTGLVILFDKDGCATKTAELPVQIIGKAFGKPTA